MAKKKSDFVSLPFCIPNDLAARLLPIVARRTLGDTMAEVVEHMVRQYVFEVEELSILNSMRLGEAGQRFKQNVDDARAGKPIGRPFPKAPATKKVPKRAHGGKARAAKLTPERRKAIAKKAGETRWSKK